MNDIVWCPACGVELFEITELPTGTEGVHENRLDPLPEGQDAESHIVCRCGGNLERRHAQ